MFSEGKVVNVGLSENNRNKHFLSDVTNEWLSVLRVVCQGRVWRYVERPLTVNGSGSGGTWTANKIFMLTKIENIPSLPTEGKLIYLCVIHS